jgi:hypothetical protein
MTVGRHRQYNLQRRRASIIMGNGSVETYERKRDLVALFKEQVAILRELMPPHLVSHLNAINVSMYDQLLAQGPSAPWPQGVLAGLRQGIRDVQAMLEMLPTEKRAALKQRLRNVGDGLVERLDEQDASRLTSIRKRGRILDDDEYYLVRAEIDRLEPSPTRDETLLRELYRLVDEASVRKE